MKKILFFAALSAAVMINSYSNDDLVNNSASGNEVSFRPVNSKPEIRVVETNPVNPVLIRAKNFRQDSVYW
jgi:hypothetical protein